MSKHIPYIAIIILLIVVHFLDESNDKLKQQLLEQKYDELKSTLDSTELELRSTGKLRDSLNHLVTDLYFHSEALQSNLDKANKKLKDIPGRYKFVPADSLSKLMEERWKNAN